MLKNILKGIFIGIANVLPGVSGGTVAVLLNIYDRLTEAIGNFFIVSNEKKIEYLKFLIQIGIGAVIGIVVFAGVVSKSYQNYPKITTIIFLILIIPSIPYILKGEKILKIGSLASFFSGVMFTIIFVYITELFSSHNSKILLDGGFTFIYGIKLFACGVVSAGAMVIPGISGSLLLVVMGEYYNIMTYIRTINIIPLLYFGIGTIIGLILVSKFINILLNKYRNYTLNFIVGVICVSLFQMLKIVL